jgi:hypothetical protein
MNWLLWWDFLNRMYEVYAIIDNISVALSFLIISVDIIWLFWFLLNSSSQPLEDFYFSTCRIAG